MTIANLCKRHMATSFAVPALSSAPLLKAVPAMVSEGEGNEPKYLFICAGDQARTSPDFLAVINFDQDSDDYGTVIATAPFAAPDATGNEPHHIGLSSDGRVVGCGGLLSVLKGQKEIFFLDVSDPKAPKFLSAARPPLSSITYEFHALPEGGFLITMMGGPAGMAPGLVVAFNCNWSRSIPRIRLLTASIRTVFRSDPSSI